MRSGTSLLVNRAGLCKAAWFVGGVYYVRQYVRDRLEVIRDKLEEDSVARNNMKVRFYKTLDDISFTAMALIPNLSEQIIEVMDVETLIQTLQQKAQAKLRASSSSRVASQETSDALSDSVSVTPSASSASSQPSTHTDPTQRLSTSALREWDQSTHLTDSILTISSDASLSLTSITDVSSSENESVSDYDGGRQHTLTKTELWNRIKLLTFSRTLTILYSTSLLSIFTTVQLTLLGRHKYLHSLRQAAHQEQVNELLDSQFTLSSLLLGGGRSMESLLSHKSTDNEFLGEEPLDPISEYVERMYLTLSWWVLNTGWKDISERVKRGVEEVINGLSLKTKLSASDLRRLLFDIRRRVEYEVTFDRQTRQVDFSSSVLPTTPEMVHHVLLQGGIEKLPILSSGSVLNELKNRSDGLHSASEDVIFATLLNETRTIFASQDFSFTLERCLDTSVNTFLSALLPVVFNGQDSDEVRVRFASLLPEMARWSQSALDGMPNRLVDSILSVSEISSLSAIVFSSFDNDTW